MNDLQSELIALLPFALTGTAPVDKVVLPSTNLFSEARSHCVYTTPNRKTDFTIADCWGIEKVAPEFDDNKGVSLLLVRSDKAKAIFNVLKDNLKWKRIPLEPVMQPQLMHPVEKGKNYDKFWFDFSKLSKNRFFNKYFKLSKIKIIVLRAKRIARRVAKK